MAARLPHRDFVMLQHYAARRLLPQRRMELYGAQHTWAIRSAFGDKSQPSDFLIEPLVEEDPLTDEEAVAEMRRALGFGDT